MYSEVSEEFINTIRSPSRTFNARLKINGKWYSTGLKKMTYENSSSSEESLQLGSAVSAKIELTVAKIDELFENTEISVEIGLKLQGGAYEYVPVGIFTAEHPTNDENSTTFTAYDRMIKTTGIYISDLSYPAKAKDVLNEISVQCGVLIDTSGIDVVIEKRPEGYTCREMIGYIASLVGGFACVNRIGTIIIKWYEQTDFKLDLSRIMTFEKTESNYHLDYLTANIDNSNSYTAGGGTLGVTFDNPFMTSSGLEDVYNKIKGFTYREVELKAPADIRLDVWDIITAAVNGVEYSVPVMNIVYEYDGGMSMTVKSFGKTEVETSTDFKGPTSKAVERMYSELITTKELVAKKVDAEWVKANTVTSEKVISIEADILSIKNNYLQTNEADIKYATIEKLDGVEGKFEDFYAKDFESAVSKINDLTVEVEKVNTIMFGSASGGSLTTEFSNSIVANIGDAQIKSAMIESIAADKITSGKIYTNLVEILSESGNLDITDNTIQIKDDKKVTRVQIGKDANSDYNMYVWDKSGNLMFDALGLTESGVKREIIRNDMIKEDANIAANKLDIESLFNVINEDGSHTLKSSKIYIDVNKQTLDVAFKNMTTNVTELQNAVTTQGTQLTAVQGQISSKIWQQDITTVVNGLQIGGRNLYLGTKDFSGNWRNLPQWKVESEKYEGLTVISRYLTWNGVDKPQDVTCKAGDIFTYSLYAKTSGEDTQAVVTCPGQTNFEAIYVAVSSEWKRYTFVIQATTDGYMSPRISKTESNYVSLFICGLKLEKGNKATDWTPAPEDTDSSISEVNTKVTAISNQYTSLNQSLTSLTATVNSNTTKISEKADGSTVTALQANVTALTADLSGFKTSVSETYTSKTEFNNLQIGGRNLIRGSVKINTTSATADYLIPGQYNGTITRGYLGNISVATSKAYQGSYIFMKNIASHNNLKQGDIVTVSIYISVDSDTEVTLPRLGLFRGDYMTPNHVQRYFNDIKLKKGEWKRLTHVFSLMPGSKPLGNTMRFESDKDTTYNILWSCPKLELGGKATDWTPAPEDVNEKFTEYSTTTQMNSAINQSASSILTTVSSNYATKASLEVKIDKDKLISEINASADVITLKSNRFVLDSTNAKIAADGTVNFIGGTIGGWKIDKHSLYSDYDKYRVYIQTVTGAEDWAFSVQEKKADGKYYGNFLVDATGYAKISDGYLATKNHSVGGKGIEIFESQVKFYSWSDKDNFTGSIYTTYVDEGNSGSQNKRQSLVICSDYNDEIHLDYKDENRNPKKAIVIDKDADHKVHMIAPTVFHGDIDSTNGITCVSNFSVGRQGTERVSRFWCYNPNNDQQATNMRIFNTDARYLNNCEMSLYGTGRVQFNWHVNGTIYGNVSSDSDKNIKKDIQALNIEDSARFIYSLIPSEFRFKNGTSNRLHHGLIAQEVKESMGDDDWGLFIDKKVDDANYSETAINELTGEQTQLMTARYSLRYDELIADLIATVQSLNNRLKALEQ